MLPYILSAIGGIILIFIAVILIRTLRFTPKALPVVDEENVSFDAQKAFDDAGVPKRCRHLIGPGGHGFDPELVWPVIMQLQEEIL